MHGVNQLEVTCQIPSSGKYYFEGQITGSGTVYTLVGNAEMMLLDQLKTDLTSGDDYFYSRKNTSYHGEQSIKMELHH